MAVISISTHLQVKGFFTYSLGVRLSSTAAVTKRIEGNLSNIVLIPCFEARIFTNIIFSSGTPFALIVSMAEQAEPPVANMGSRMITASQN